MGLILESLNYLEKLLKKESIVFLDFPSGIGRTYLLKSFYKKYNKISLFTHYASHRTPIGEFFYTLFQLIDKKAFFKEKGEIVGPILRRYIHPRFMSFLGGYKPEKVVSLEHEISQILDIANIILENKNIRYWIFDNWQEYLNYNVFFEEIIPFLAKKFDIKFLITGNNFTINAFIIKPENYIVPIHEEGIIIYEMKKAFDLTQDKAKLLFELSDGNWNNALVIWKNGFRPLQEIIYERVNMLSENEKKALFTFTFIGKTFSSTTIKAVKELYGPLNFMKNLMDSYIIRWEHPLWRFASDYVLDLIREYLSLDYHGLKENFVRKLSSFNYSDIWSRLAILCEENKKYWTYVKLREFRDSYNIQRKQEILKEIIEKGEDHKDLYRRYLVELLVDSQNFGEALEVLEDIQEKNIVDYANQVRCLSYLGKYDEAEKVLDSIVVDLPISYETPQVLSKISSYYFLTKRNNEGLLLLNKYLGDILGMRSSPKYLANFYNSLGLLTLGNGKYEKALSLFESGLNYAEKTNDKIILHKLLNNLGDLRNYLYGPKGSIKFNLEAYHVSRSLSKNLRVISLGNLIKSKAQYSSYKEVAILLDELEDLLEDVKFEYFLYSGYRRLAITYLNYGMKDKLEKVIDKLKNIKNISESNILLFLLLGFLGEEVKIDEGKVLDSKEEQLITLYMKLIVEKDLKITKSLRNFPTDYPIHNFLKGYLIGESFINLLSYIDLMLERWEFLDALYCYKVLLKVLEKDENLKVFAPYIKLEILGISILLKIQAETELLMKELSPIFKDLMAEHSQIKALEDYMGKAIIDSENEEEALELIYRIISDFDDNFLVTINIGDKVLQKGNRLLDKNHFRFTYKKSPFSISIYSLNNLDPSLFFVIRNLLKSFIVFWERKYGMFDPLTGLFNRSYGERKIEEAFADFLRDNEEFSIVFIDIDSFKKINDNLGHSYGDYVLREIANAIRASIRQSDSAIRWGGDEFLILLRRADYNEALKVVKRIKGKIEEVSRGEIKISYGIETSSEDVSSYREIIDKADVKMYNQKFRKFNKKEDSIID